VNATSTLPTVPYDYVTEAGEGVHLMEGERRLLGIVADFGPLFDATAFGVQHTALSEIYLARLADRGLLDVDRVGPLQRLRFTASDLGRKVLANLPAERLRPGITAGQRLI
jgi:hypothetical protein